MILEIENIVGTFLHGERVTGQSSGAYGDMVAADGLLCCDQVDPTDIIVPYFSATFYLFVNQITLSDVVGSFSGGESVIGSESGATATVYSDWSVWDRSPAYIEPGGLARHGYSCAPEPTVAEAWANHDGAPEWDTFNPQTGAKTMAQIMVAYGYYDICEGELGYKASESRSFWKFDTTDAPAGGTAAKLKFTVLVNASGDGSLSLGVYKCEFGDTVEQSDWAEGTLIGEEVAPEGSGKNIEVDIGIGNVNVGGFSRYKIVINEGRPGVPKTYYLGQTDNMKLRLTKG